MDTYSLTLEQSNREGKKVDHFFTLNKEEDIFITLIDELKKVIKDEGLDFKLLQASKSSPRRGRYERIRKKMGLMVSKRQQDVYDFIAFLLNIMDDAC